MKMGFILEIHLIFFILSIITTFVYLSFNLFYIMLELKLKRMVIGYEIN